MRLLHSKLNRKTLGGLVAFSVLISAFSICHAEDFYFTLTPGSEKQWSFAGSPPATLEELRRNWGQFELLVPKENFPIPAPHCRGVVKLRWIAIKPTDPDGESKLIERWKLVERLKAMRGSSNTSNAEKIKVETRYYTKKSSTGKIELEYCNSFVGANE